MGNFFAISRGKGAVDGIGGTVKRSVWKNVRITAVAPVDAESYAKLANELIENVTILYISAEAITEKCASRLAIWKKVRNSNQLEVSATSTNEIFKLVNIFKSNLSLSNDEMETDESDLTDTENAQDSDNDDTLSSIQISMNDWVLVQYENEQFPGEVTKVVGADIEVNVMHKSGNSYWKWPKREDKIFYAIDNIVKKIEQPEVAGTRGQFFFKDLK